MDGAQYLVNGKQASVDYEAMFDNNKKIKVDGLGSLAYYPNRDSLKYLTQYDLPDAKTFLRATLRHPDFCKGWQALVALDLTNMSDQFNGAGETYASWMRKKTGYNGSQASLTEHIARKLEVEPNGKVMGMINWLGLFEETPLPQKEAASGDFLLEVLQDKWEMKPKDKDMVVMQHEVEYLHRDRKIKMCSSMVLKGDDREFSAMAKTVGLPMGILARMVMKNKITLPTGVVIPNMPGVYRPVLTELQHYGIVFREEVV
jgi:saccharopine dehydrogenase-like NADP-dependent oxidoreductase